MEALYLLGSIVSTSIISFTLSLLLPFQALLRRFCSLRSSRINGDDSFSLYEGTVWHDRRRPVRHSFRYSVRYGLFDLDRSLQAPPDHLSADEARRMAQTTGPVFLLTIPPSVGYEQNPLSLYYCYDIEGSTKHLKQCIAEVTNTPWGERVLFVFNPKSDLVAKPLHVSPFMDMLGNWSIRANAPGDNLSVSITVQHPDLGEYFVAIMKARRIPSSPGLDHAIFFWLMPHKVAMWIYWQAFQLWWKNVSFIEHPRYTCPSYREVASLRDQKLRCSQATGSYQDEHLEINASNSALLADRNSRGCRFSWRDAKWPWS